MNKSRFLIIKILAAVMVQFVVIGCSPSEDNSTGSSNSDAPQAAIDGAINSVKSLCGQMKHECTSFTVAFADSKDLTQSDKLNGISKSYQIGIDYALKNQQGKWLDVYHCLYATNTNGKWDIVRVYMPDESLKENKICARQL